MAVGGAADDVWDVGCGEFELGFLFEGCVGGRGAGAEGVEEILFVLLGDPGREWGQVGEDVVGY